MRYASLCSGIEAATVAWSRLGWRPVFFSETAKFPSAVLAHHYARVPNLGDMTLYQSWGDYEVDMLVAGTPCQSFSVAGNRTGLYDARGQLAVVYLAIAERYRPMWLVWENVADAMSVNSGRDFKAWLIRLAECGYGFAYRVFDAAGFGISQHRRRVYVVGYFGDWRRAAAVLFERACLSWNPAPQFQTGPDDTGENTTRTKSGGVIPGIERTSSTGETSRCLNAGAMSRQDFETETLISYHDTATDTYRVRRLTPRECERLMGFPDDYTAIQYRRKPAPDSLRYNALGNSFAVPVVEWIGRRIEMVERSAAATADGVAQKSDAPERPLFDYFGARNTLPLPTSLPTQQEFNI